MPDDKFTCAVCGDTFEAAWSDDEALSELEDKFPGVTVETCAIVCDDCYKILMEHRRAN